MSLFAHANFMEKSRMRRSEKQLFKLALLASLLILGIIWLLSNAISPFALLVVQQMIRFFWKAPIITAVGFILATLAFSVVIQRRLQAGKIKAWTWALLLFLFLLGYVLSINIAHDIGFCFDVWKSADISKSYCRVDRYFSLFDWGARFLIGSLSYGVLLSILVLVVNIILARSRLFAKP